MCPTCDEYWCESGDDPCTVIALLDEIDRLQASAEREMESTPWPKVGP